MAVMTAEKKNHRSSKKVPMKKLVRVLLDSGSDGDLLFHAEGAAKHFPYSTRQVPKPWHMSNGIVSKVNSLNIAIARGCIYHLMLLNMMRPL